MLPSATNILMDYLLDWDFGTELQGLAIIVPMNYKSYTFSGIIE